MFRRHRQIRLLSRVAMSFMVAAVGLVSATHYHFGTSQVSNDGAVQTTSCGCPHSHSLPDSDLPERPSEDRCHVCKILSQLLADCPLDFCCEIGDLAIIESVPSCRVDTVGGHAYYLSRGPPARI